MDFVGEAEPFDVRIARGGGAEDSAVEVVQRREQRDGAMAGVLVGARADVANAQWQARLPSLQRLALALLVAAQNQRSVRRIAFRQTGTGCQGLRFRRARDYAAWWG